MSCTHRVDEVDVAEHLRSGAELCASVPADELTRLADVVTLTGAADVRVNLNPDDVARARVQGRCAVDVQIACARCAMDVELRLDCSLDLRLVASEADARALAPDVDVAVCDAPRVPIAVLIEDDLLLVLPEVGCDDGESCEHWLALQREWAAARDVPEDSADMTASAGDRRASPFDVLETLLPRSSRGPR